MDSDPDAQGDERMRRLALEAATGGIRGLRRLHRPAEGDSPAFELSYVRTGPGSGARASTSVVVIPGGPGLASVLPYRSFRRWGASGGLDLVMVEHRGVGLSRHDVDGRVLGFDAMWTTRVVDDIAAVLDREGIDRAVIVGASYGSYLASGVGVRHPERVAALVLDSALQSTADLGLERQGVRSVLWEADTAVARSMRALVERGDDQRRLLDIARAAWELDGAGLTSRVLGARLARASARRGSGRRGSGRHGQLGADAAWLALEAYASRGTSIAHVPGVYEFDRVGAIGFRELDYAAEPDGLPLDPALTYAPLADRFPAFAGEVWDFPAQTPVFDFPVVALVGDRDLRTPPAVGERTAATARDGTVVRIRNGHSALESHPLALLNVIRRTVEGRQHRLPDQAAALDALPRRGAVAQLPALLSRLSRL